MTITDEDPIVYVCPADEDMPSYPLHVPSTCIEDPTLPPLTPIEVPETIPPTTTCPICEEVVPVEPVDVDDGFVRNDDLIAIALAAGVTGVALGLVARQLWRVALKVAGRVRRAWKAWRRKRSGGGGIDRWAQ